MGENYLDRDRDLLDFFSEVGEFDYEKQHLLKSGLLEELAEEDETHDTARDGPAEKPKVY